jgi:hypothetical protein
MMNSEELNAFLAELLGEHLEKFRAEIERMVAAIALPPFMPPPVWMAGRHAAGATVRHRNGLFTARRDTSDEPPTEAWLPVLVGIATVGVEWPSDRRMVMRIELSDGTMVETEREFLMPIARGFWKAEETYNEGDRVLRFGDWQAAKASIGIDPNTAANDGHWLKVTGKQHREVSFKLDDDGRMFENGHQIGSIKPMVAQLLGSLIGAAR